MTIANDPGAVALPPPPHYSPDGRWFWNNAAWVPAQYPQPAKTASVPVGAIGMILGGIALFVGAFLPWVSVFGGVASVSGVDGGDGWFFVAGGALVALLAAFGLSGKTRMATAVSCSVLGMILGGLLAMEWVNVHDHLAKPNQFAPNGFGAYASYGMGLYILAVGAGLAILGGLVECIRLGDGGH